MDRNGKVKEAENEAELVEFMRSNRRLIKRTELPNGVLVSTAFIATGDRDRLFETAAFAPDSWDPLWRDNFGTMQQALWQHSIMVQHYRGMDRLEVEGDAVE